MPKKLRPQSRRQRRAVAPLAQGRRAARSHPCKRSLQHTNSCQGQRRHQRRRCPHPNNARRAAPQVPRTDTASPSYRAYKNSEELRSRIISGIITPIHEYRDKDRMSSPHREFPAATAREVDPLRIHPYHPHTSRQPPW